MGMTGIILVLIATLLGGSRVPIERYQDDGLFFRVDWFLLSIILYSAVFVPIERMFARLPEQPILRKEWRTDLAYFFVSSVLLQVTTLMTMEPAMAFFSWAANEGIQLWVSGLPFIVQFLLILEFTDLA